MGADERLRTDSGLPLDTSAEAHRVQRGVYLKMGGAARLAIAFQLNETIRNVAMAGIRHRHPDYANEEVRLAWARRSGDSERQLRDAVGVLELNPSIDKHYAARWARV